MSSSNASPSKHHSQEADELDFLCRKMSDVRVRARIGVTDEELHLGDVSLEQFEGYLSQLQMGNSISQKNALIKFRKLLAHDDIHPHLDKILEFNCIPYFVSYLSDSFDPELQFEAAWILTNIAAGTSQQTEAVVNSGALDKLVDLLGNSPNKNIKEQSCWCLGNVTGDGVEMRTRVLDSGALQPLLQLITDEMNEYLSTNLSQEVSQTDCSSNSPRKQTRSSLATLRIAIWALSNFCRGDGRSELDWNLVDIAMPVLSQVITCCAPGTPHTDDEILMDSCWALSRTLRGIHEGVGKVIVNADVCQKIGLLINHDNADVQIPALRCLINIVSGSDAQTQVVIDSGILPYIKTLLEYPQNQTVLKEACLIVSNITAGTVQQVQAIIDMGLIQILTEILRNSDYKTQREACWALSNAFLNRNYQQVAFILENGTLELLLNLLYKSLSNRRSISVHDERVMIKILEACRNVIMCGEDNPINMAEIDGQLLNQFNGMSIDKKVDSAYSSLTELEDKKSGSNPFISKFNFPVENGSQLTGIDLISSLASGAQLPSFSSYIVMPEMREFAQDIIGRI